MSIFVNPDAGKTRPVRFRLTSVPPVPVAKDEIATPSIPNGIVATPEQF